MIHSSEKKVSVAELRKVLIELYRLQTENIAISYWYHNFKLHCKDGPSYHNNCYLLWNSSFIPSTSELTTNKNNQIKNVKLRIVESNNNQIITKVIIWKKKNWIRITNSFQNKYLNLPPPLSLFIHSPSLEFLHFFNPSQGCQNKYLIFITWFQ